MKKTTPEALEAHPIAAIFPMLPPQELEEMAESIQRSGQREPIVLHEGKILDGRNTLAACTLAGVTPTFREYDPATEGPPIRYVLDKNLERRHLTPSQRAAASTAALAFLDGDAKGKVADLAALAGVSKRTMTDAITAGKAGKTDDIIAGKTSAAAAAKKARKETPKKGKAKEKDDTGADDTAEIRAENEGALKKAHGDQFARAFATGAVLKTKKEIKEFLELSTAAQKDLTEFLAQGWPLAKAIKFHTREIDTTDDIASLILRAVATGKDAFSCVVAGYVISAKRQK